MTEFQFHTDVAKISPELVRHWPRPSLKFDAIADELTQCVEVGGFGVKTLGQSALGADIRSVTIGRGETRVLAWTQMHGDEPTHTSVVLDLIRFLATQPEHPVARNLFENVTLTLIPVLNPDGTAVNTRRNAQGIDINRDARVLQSPEGRILRDAVLRLKPQFAFNLHNQNRRRTVIGTNRLNAVALLTPPPNASDEEPPHLLDAKRVASCFCLAVQDECEGMLSRYGADYMPRAFGEWVQSQGVSTVLVEAGGWPGGDTSRLVDVHFRGCLSALMAIATGEYKAVDAAVYEGLPRGESYERIDCIVRNVRVALPHQAPFAADVGINFEQEDDGKVGRISDIGDLSVHEADCVLDGQGMQCSAGRIAICSDVSLSTGPDSSDLPSLHTGVTTAVGLVRAADVATVEAWRKFSSKARCGTNIAFAVLCTEEDSFERLVEVAANGAVAVATGSDCSEATEKLAKKCAALFGLPVVKVSSDTETGVIDWPAAFRHLYAPRGQIAVGAPADIVLSDSDGFASIVLINGHVAYSDGQYDTSSFGKILRRRTGRIR